MYIIYIFRTIILIFVAIFGYVTESNERLYPLYHVSLKTSVYEFLGIINLMSSATIFTCAHLEFCYHCIFFLVSSIPSESRGELSEGKLTGDDW